VLSGPNSCGSGAAALPGVNPATTHAQGRCGYGPRLPLLVISPWAKRNFVDHTMTDQSSILRFVEDNWLHAKRIGAGSFDTIANPIDNMFNFERPESNGHVLLDPSTGTVEGGFGGW
jgi:phospholipase C